MRALLVGAALVLAFGVHAIAQREHTRPTPNRSTAVTETQATELTLTLTEAAVRPIQLWVRTGGAVDSSGRTVSASVPGDVASRVRVGQRVRAFSPESRSRMYQATVADVTNDRDKVVVKAALASKPLETSRYYVLEIVTDAGDLLSVPNEAIIESGGKQVVYIQGQGGTYEPREIGVGVRGELFTEVTRGLEPGEQVVTIGSFFIDAEHKLKGS
jgi:Cu(I)/Ag(I) efflux system membrane fusion protein